jgi:RNA-directed DNA polymerase
MSKHYPKNPWCRYADDAVVHCATEGDANHLLAALKDRFQDCQLELHPDKTKIVYCQDANRKEKHLNAKFTFLGYEFRRKVVKAKEAGNLFLGFAPAVSKEALKAMRRKIRKTGLRSKTELSLEEIAHMFNPILTGWIEYYGRYTPSALYPVLKHFNKTLAKWAGRKYKKLRGRKTAAAILIQAIAEKQPDLFVHWKRGITGVFA